MSEPTSTPNYASDMSESDAMSIHDRLALARQNAGFNSAREAAAAMGVTYSTYAGHENGSRGLGRSAARYAAFFNVPIDWLLLGKGKLPNPQPSENTPLIAANRLKNHVAKSQPTVKIKVVGRVAAGVFREIDTMSFDRFPTSPFPPDPNHPIEAQFDLIVEGHSINRFARDGEILRCVDIYKADIEPVDGDLVIVRKKRQDGTVETTAKRARRKGIAWELWFDSDEPRYQGMVTLDPQDGDEIEIIAVVLYSYKPARPLAALP